MYMKMKTAEKLLYNVCGVFSILYALIYGVTAYAAPAFFFGPGGPLNLYKRPVHEISIQYMRFHGLNTLSLVLSFLLFARGNVSREKAFTRMLLSTQAAMLFIGLRVMFDDDFEDRYQKDAWVGCAVICLLHIVVLTMILRKYPSPIVQEAPIEMADRIGLTLLDLYATLVCFSRLIFGPDPHFWDMSKLEDGKFELEMRECAYMFATSMVPIVFFLTFDAWNLPRFAYKMNAMYVIMALPIIYKECYNSSGYGKPKAFAATFVGQLAFGIFSMTRLGAFRKENTMKSASPKVVGKIA
mmetsp:Transcript_12723/g.26313  ORF Transcript_12723/g.26313 Transcript_12723/m.26313 type:complete len:298 (+) Transcript_12723:293-1186(+)